MASGKCALIEPALCHLLDLLVQKKIVASDIITHSLKLEEAPAAYKTFCAKQDSCVKVVLHP